MSPNRRDFLQGALGAFAAALIPFDRPRQLLLPGPKEAKPLKPVSGFDYLDDLVQVPKLDPDPEMHTFLIDECALSLGSQRTRLLAQSIHISFPKDPAYLKRFPCRMSINRLIGPAEHVREFYRLGDIGHEDKLYFGVGYRDGDGCVPAFIFHRPILVSCGMSAFSMAKVKDMMSGVEHEIRPEDQMGIVDSLQLMCSKAPDRLDDFRFSDYAARMQPASDPKRHYDAEQTDAMDPEQRASYEEWVADNADDNRDLSAWERAGINLNELCGLGP